MKNNNIKSFVVGFLSATFVFTAVPAMAAGIEAKLNSINIEVNGAKVASVGENATLSNGSTAPYSISYNDTTYVTLRGIGDILGLDVQFDGKTNTAKLNGKNSQQASNGISDGVVSSECKLVINGKVILKDSFENPAVVEKNLSRYISTDILKDYYNITSDEALSRYNTNDESIAIQYNGVIYFSPRLLNDEYQIEVEFDYEDEAIKIYF